MTLKVNSIHKLNIFNTEINESHLQMVPSSFIENATAQINKALNTTKVQNALKDKNVKKISYEVFSDQMIFHIEGEKISVEINPKPFEEIYEYLRRSELLQKNPLFEAFTEVCERKKRNVVKSSLSSDIACTGNVISIVRNGLVVEPTIGPKHLFVTFLGTLSGILSLATGFYLINSAYNLHTTSSRIEDSDGENRAAFLSFSGINLIFLGASFSVEQAYQTFVDSQGGTVFGKMIAPLYILATLLTIIYASYCLHKTKAFKGELNTYLYNEGLTPLKRLKAAMNFLKDQLEATALEKYKIKQFVEEEYIDKQTRERVTKEKIKKLLRKKRIVFERNTNTECANLLKKFNLKKLYSEDSETVKSATEICQKVIDTNNKRSLYFMIMLVTSIIGLAAAILFVTTHFVVLPSILAVISALLWLSINHEKISQKVSELMIILHKKIYGSLNSKNILAGIPA